MATAFNPLCSRPLRSLVTSKSISRSRVIAASARTRAPSGSVPGRIGGIGSQSFWPLMRGRSPARISDDLPQPDGPTTVRIVAVARSGDRSRSARSVISRPRPKNTRCSPNSNDRSPGYGDLSSGHPHPPPPSISLSRSPRRLRASEGSCDASTWWMGWSREWISSLGEKRTGSNSVPSARAAPISAAHHTDFRYDAVTTQTTASASRSWEYKSLSHSSPGSTPSFLSRSRNTSWPSSFSQP